MLPPATQSKATKIPRDAYPVIRVSMEFFLRGFDALSHIHDDMVDGLIVMTLVHHHLNAPNGEPVSVRKLSHMTDLPFETVRRRVKALACSRKCTLLPRGVVVPETMRRGHRIAEYLRKVYVEAARLLTDLTAIGVARFAMTSRRPALLGRLTREQTTIAMAATSLLLKGMQAVRAFWGRNLMKGLVVTAIWTANVKHATSSPLVANRSMLTDSSRVPVSGRAISRSLRVPYETVRRHASALVRDGICIRSGTDGLVVPTHVHQRLTLGTVITYGLVMEFLSDLRRAGIVVESIPTADAQFR